eukprot:scaffold37681_cov54-Attheya_sp.AAC.2
MKDEDDEKVLTQQLEQLYDDGKRKNEVPLKYLGDVARDDWDTEKVRQANMIAGFKATMYAWNLMILPEDICEAQKN